MKTDELARRVVAHLNPQLSEAAKTFIDEYCEGAFSRSAPLIFRKAVPDDLQPGQVLGISTAMVMLPAVDMEAL